MFVVRRCGQALLPGSSYLNRSEALVPRMFYPLLDSDLRWTRHPQRHFPISKHWCCTFLYWIVLRRFFPCRILSKESKWVEAQVRPIVSGRTHRLPAFVVVVPPVELLLFRLLRREKPQQRTKHSLSEQRGARRTDSALSELRGGERRHAARAQAWPCVWLLPEPLEVKWRT